MLDPVAGGEELTDLVDEDDRVIGRAARSEVRRRNLLHRSVGVLCRNSAGDVYVHRRTDSKDVFPGMYDAFAGEMVASGELAEELGVVGVELRPLVKQRYRGPDLQTWNLVFETVWDGPIVPQAISDAWGTMGPSASCGGRWRPGSSSRTASWRCASTSTGWTGRAQLRSARSPAGPALMVGPGIRRG